MLVLSRKKDETILIGDDIVVTIMETRRNNVRLAIDAPCDIRILRGELQLQGHQFNKSLIGSQSVSEDGVLV